MNPQIYGYLQERLQKLGVLDTFVTPVQMKKNRPGFLLTVVTAPENFETVADTIFRETTTIGIRYYEADRRVLEREVVPIELEYGIIRVKISRREGRIVNFSPEYEDCRVAAEKHGIPVKWIQARIAQEFMSRYGSDILKDNHERQG